MNAELDIALRALIDIVAALILTYILFYRRYKNKELFVSAMILNISVFCVMSIITDGNIGLQAGLGLFAILSILRFRSDNFEKMEMAYFFAAVAIAAVNGIAALGTPLFIANALILLMVLVIDGEIVMRQVDELTACLDSVPDYLFDDERARQELGKKFGIDVVRFEIKEIDYVKDSATLKIHFNRSYPGRAWNRLLGRQWSNASHDS